MIERIDPGVIPFSHLSDIITFIKYKTPELDITDDICKKADLNFIERPGDDYSISSKHLANKAFKIYCNELGLPHSYAFYRS